MKSQAIEQLLRRQIAQLLHEPAESIDVSRSLSELGLDSVNHVDIAAFLRKEFGVPLTPEALFEFSSVRETAEHLAGLIAGAQPAPEPRAEPRPSSARAPDSGLSERDVAIIGVSLRVPGARSLEELWSLITRGESRIREFPAERAPASEPGAIAPRSLQGGFVEDVEAFDAAFFGISPREALAMDPQQRLLLECAWHAFEDAGCPVERLSGSNTSVFVGASSFDYYELLVRTQAARTTHIGTGISHAILANRISQYFNLKGASEAIDTACSSSLVALSRAVESLRRGESGLALVAGVNVLASRTPFQVFADAGMLSPEGRCLPFDDSAAGYVRGEGVACVVLKRASEAVRDGDRILAIIKGGAVRHSGRTNSLTAPNPDAQADVIVAASRDAGVDPAGIGYVEAHGTGTSLGDPIEVSGLKKAFARLHGEHGRTSVAPHFFLGSVKAQIGHLEAAAGLAGLLKGVAALLHQSIPGSPYLTQLNRHIDLSDASFRISREVLPWEGTQDGVSLPVGPRRAGVSSFGFGGVNAHVVLEEAPPVPERAAAKSEARLFLLSARSEEALVTWATRLADHLGAQHFETPSAEQAYLEDVAFTLRQGRTPLPHRLALVATSVSGLVEQLRRYAREGARSPEVFTGTVRGETPEWVELFSDEAELAQRLAAMVAQGELRKLARLWTQGLVIDWAQVFPRGASSLVSLPGYPFARERFWVRQASGRPGAAFYAARWVPKPLQVADSRVDGALVVLVGGEKGRHVAEAVGRMLPRLPLRISECPEEGRALQPMAAELLGDMERVGAVVDLSPLDEDSYRDSRQVLRKLEWVRHLVGGPLKKGALLELVQVTLGLQDLGRPGRAPVSLAGAQDAGLFASLGAEYRRCRSRTMDFPAGDFDAEVIAGQLARELEHSDGESELAYDQGQRFVRRMERVAAPEARTAGGEGGVALITGGTGDIGLRVAGDLVERGFRALLLTGRRELSPDKRSLVEDLERRGTAVVLYRGELTDAEALGKALEDFRAAHGRITHVFHCAGAVDRQAPAFFQKTAGSMATVMGPKVDALRVMHSLFEQEPPRAFVLFSSVSSVAPRLAAGVLDYAAANRFLDLFAQYQHAHGHRYYHSIQWTRWQGLGLARGTREAADGSGLPLEVDACLEALHRVLAAGDSLGPSLCVLAEGDSSLMVRPTPERAPQPVAAVTPSRSDAPNAGQEELRRKLRAIVAKELETEESKLDDEAPFEELGIDSIVLMGITSEVETWLGLQVDPAELIRCDSLAAVARYLADRMPPEALSVPSAEPAQPEPVPASPVRESPAKAQATVSATEPVRREEGPFRVAIIGMACRFPGASDKESFWRNLVAGVDCVGPVPSSRWDRQATYAPRHSPGKSISQWGGFVDGIERISPSLFGLSAEDAADVDPLIRLFTECSLAAVLDSPYGRDGLQGRRVGVFTGARTSGYAERIAVPGKHSITGIGQNFISAYVSHVLDLRGPSLVLDCACSSSLAAVHLACQSLRAGDSELAIAGGVEVLLDEKPYLFLSAAHALSPDGRCRTFDEKANGFVPGEGVGCVLLKPLERALADGDPIYAVIDGSAMNNDGHTLGITTPGVEGQVDVITRALRNAGCSPRSISYVEAHGTGTMIGDPIELQALSRAFAQEPPEHCGVGSVKTSLGHLLCAAGVASLIKVALSLHHRMLPPTLHCERVNPRFEFDRTPFHPQSEAQAWEGQGARRAGISSFGFGKTNVHLIVAERPEQARRPKELEAAPRPIPEEELVVAWHPARPVTVSSAPEPEPEVAALLALEDVWIEELSDEGKRANG
ncbi:SDR family NAD(P)-dependent oxidoreductase [Archangium minus]|uniref:SDR family NAD(P)-dependent oxidoreductase n=1 Tax=Archangium minus TaxID=83450 RepID=A0ABY9WUV0_9BACT|nr:SDR family NAD(P)-dependent oxidoreductase [Archangium minus]